MESIQGLQHVTVYRDAAGEWNAAFPEITRMEDGQLVVAFREAPFPPTVPAGDRTHAHDDPLARGAILRSADGGLTWDPETYRLLAEPLGGVEQISVSAVSGGLLISPHARLRPAQTRSTPQTWLDLLGYDVWVRRSADGGDTWDGPRQMTLHPLSWAAVHTPML